LVRIWRPGQRPEERLVHLGRAGREEVLIEAGPGAGPFVRLARGGRAEWSAASLAEAIALAHKGDTIEVRGDGPFTGGPFEINQPLRLRAGKGHRPVFRLEGAPERRHGPLLRCLAPVVLEGLTLIVGGLRSHEFGWVSVVSADRAPVMAA